MTARAMLNNLDAWAAAQGKLGLKLHDVEWYDWRELSEECMQKALQAFADRDPHLAGRILDLGFQQAALREVEKETGIQL